MISLAPSTTRTTPSAWMMTSASYFRFQFRSRSGSLQPSATGSLLRSAEAFMAPAQFAFGNSGRNILYGPGTKQLDFSLFKSFALGERGERRLQFRAEAFNALNTPQFNNPSSSIGFAGVAKITSAGTPTVFQRTSRQIRVALKVY